MIEEELRAHARYHICDFEPTVYKKGEALPGKLVSVEGLALRLKANRDESSCGRWPGQS
jgi:hypothetical protein